MSTLQISAPRTTESSAEPQRPGLALRILRTVIEAMAEANRLRAEREIARVAHRHRH